MLSGLSDTKFVDKKILVNGYMIFSPIFFAFIGISADFSNFKPEDIWFAAAFVFVGIIAKIRSGQRYDRKRRSRFGGVFYCGMADPV